jgi:SsrA-binding protein
MPQPKSQKSEENILAENRKAFHQYEILEKITAGIVLTGPEVKSARAKQINLKPGYASIENSQAILKNVHIAPYKPANDEKYKPERFRQLLLHKKEIAYLDSKLSEKGLTLIPLQAHLTKGKIKILLGLCRGKQLYDKRQALKKKAQNMEIKRVLKRY